MLATNVSESEEAAEEKLRWAFRLYDKDSSGIARHLISGQSSEPYLQELLTAKK